MYSFNTVRKEHHRQSGQGLVEYALILVMVAVVVIVILTQLGPGIGNIFCKIVNELDEEQSPICVGGASDVVTLFKTPKDEGGDRWHIDVTSKTDGIFNEGAILTISPPGETMKEKDDHYHFNDDISGCPCTVTITSSLGGSMTITIG